MRACSFVIAVSKKCSRSQCRVQRCRAPIPRHAVWKGVDPTNIPYVPKTGKDAPTSSEVYALRIAQKAIAAEPTINLKGKTITELVNLIKKAAAAGSKPPADKDNKLTPLVSLASLMGDVSDPAEFQQWASELGFDVMAPLVQLDTVAEAQESDVSAEQE